MLMHWKTTIGGIVGGLPMIAKGSEMISAGDIFGGLGAVIAGCGMIFAGYHASDK